MGSEKNKSATLHAVGLPKSCLMVLDCTRGRGVPGSARNNGDLEREETERRERKLCATLRELASLRFFSLVEKSNEVRARRASVQEK